MALENDGNKKVKNSSALLFWQITTNYLQTSSLQLFNLLNLTPSFPSQPSPFIQAINKTCKCILNLSCSHTLT